MKKLLIFDMDGTLIDTDNVLIHTWREMFDDFLPNYKYTDDLFVSFSGPSLLKTITTYFKDFDYDTIVKVYNQRTGRYYDMYARLFPEERKYLQKIKDLGYTMGIVTNKIRERTEYCLKLLGIEEFFDFAVCGDDVKECKPSPEGLNKCLEHFNRNKEDALFIGDTSYDYKAAVNAGVDCILLTVAPRTYEDDVKPKKFLPSYKDLYEEIKSL